MKRRQLIGYSFLLVTGCTTATSYPQSKPSNSSLGNLPDRIRFTVTEVSSLAQLQRDYGEFRTTLEEVLEKKVEFVPVESYIAAAAALQLDQLDFVLTGPSEYVVIRARTNAVPAIGITRPNYYTIICVSANSKIDSLGDLKGKKIALWKVGSTSGYLGPTKILIDSKLDPKSDLHLEAETIRLQIIVGSMVLSVVFATILGFYTSRQIARPIEWVNHVALRVTQQSNFKLIAPVFSNDEVGSLANSINQLVKWVGSYTQELELARQTLEERVEERTKELQQTLQELKQAQSQLIQSEKMSSLGQLVAGIAHEINNPVNFIYGNLEYTKSYTEGLLELVNLYQQSYPRPILAIEEKIEEIDLPFLAEDLPKIVSSMKMGTERIRQIVLSLRNFSRLDEAEMKAVDIHEGIENTLLILNNRLKRGIGVIREYGDLPLVECYPAQLNQVFMNIIANAIDAFEQVKNTDATEKCSRSPKIVISTDKVEGNHIRVSIRDNGSGISPEIKNKLFDPFFTTKPMGKGTGLGLSISYQIIEKHQGKIDVISELGEGTEFIIKLPSKQ